MSPERHAFPTRTLHLSGEKNNTVPERREKSSRQAGRETEWSSGTPPEDHQADLQQICPPRQLDQRLDQDQWSALHSSGPARGENPAEKIQPNLTPRELPAASVMPNTWDNDDHNYTAHICGELRLIHCVFSTSDGSSIHILTLNLKYGYFGR